MSQNLPISQGCSAGLCLCDLRQYAQLRFRVVRRHCFLWFVLAIAPLKLLFASEMERMHIRAWYLHAIARIDFVSIYGLLNDLLW